MSDIMIPAQRHRCMSHIRSRNTKPELKVRQWLWRHGYDGCCKIPLTNRDFWVAKIRRNQERDQRNYQILMENGWQVLVVWECWLKHKLLEQTMLRLEQRLLENYLAILRPQRTSLLPVAAEPVARYEALEHETTGGSEKSKG